MRGPAVAVLAVLSVIAVACGGAPTGSQAFPTPVGASGGRASAPAQPQLTAPTAAASAAATAAIGGTPAPALGTSAPPQGSPGGQTPPPKLGAPGAQTAAPNAATTASPAPATSAPAAPAGPTTTVTPSRALVGVNLSSLPIGDNKRSTTTPAVGSIYVCPQEQFGGHPVPRTGPWITGNTWDMTKKITVDGSVTWSSQSSSVVSGAVRTVTTNGLPSHETGVWPVQRTDDAYQYDPNPGSIKAVNTTVRLSAEPAQNPTVGCMRGGTIGVMLTGGVLWLGFDANGLDPVAREIQDQCGGHPGGPGTYHYHGVPSCAADTASGHSALFGYILDGFGIYGPRADAGMLGTQDLDVCHGHAHEIDWNGVRKVMYHYHFTYDFPYSVSCYRGTAVNPPRG